MFTKYITPAVTAIEENKTETATNIYVAMTNVLAERYNIDTNIITINEKDIDMTTLGHGRIRKRHAAKAACLLCYQLKMSREGRP